MKRIIPFYFVLILAWSFISCDEDYTIENVAFKPKLVLNSLFSPDAVMNIHLSHSRNILDSDMHISAIANAQVSLSDADGNDYGFMEHISDGNYQIPGFLPAVGVEYIVHVSVEGFESISAQSAIPVPINVNDDKIQTTSVNYKGRSAVQIDLSFYDIDQMQNYFVWEVLDEIEPGFTGILDIKDAIRQDLLLAQSELSTDQILANDQIQSKIFLTDDGDDQAEYDSSMLAFNPKSQTSNSIDIKDKQLIMRLLTVSKDLYEYYKSVEFSRLKGNANSSITQPLNVYNNVTGGLGIFAGYTQQVEAL